MPTSAASPSGRFGGQGWRMLVDVSIVVATISGVLGLGAVAYAHRNAKGLENLKADIAERKDAKAAARQRAQRIQAYSAPLAHAAFDLQSRLYNFLRKDFAEVSLKGDDEKSRSYAVENTAFLVAQYFCWSELARQQVHHIELENPEKTRELLRLQDRLHSEWGTDRYALAFRIFAGEQRAIGEALFVGTAGSIGCLGYGQFLKAFPTGENALIDAVRADVVALENGFEAARPRLTKVQHTLIELLDLLDPTSQRFRAESRSKA